MNRVLTILASDNGSNDNNNKELKKTVVFLIRQITIYIIYQILIHLKFAMDRITEIQSSIKKYENAISHINNKIAIIDANNVSSFPSRSHTGNSNIIKQKLRILALLKQLKTIPIKSPNSKITPKSLINTQLRSQSSLAQQQGSTYSIKNDLKIHYSLSTILDNVINHTDGLISNINVEPTASSHYLLKINSLKSNSRKLSSYIKVLVNDYLFTSEFQNTFKKLDNDSLKSRKQKFLKLLESLLNNNILNPNSNTSTWITLATVDDPLIRFLLLNRIISLHPTLPNKIMLKDLSVDL